MGRNAVKLDYGIVDTALYYGATIEQIRFLLESKGTKVTTKTIQRAIERDKKVPFSKYREYVQGGIKLKLAQKQVEVAMAGNVSMLIWLGKNLLGQSDTPHIKDEEQNELEFV